MSKISHISFDLDHTLFDLDRTLELALIAVTQFLKDEVGIHLDSATLHEERNEIAKTPEGKSMKLLELRRASFASILQWHPDTIDLVDGAMQVFESVRFNQNVLYTDSVSVLRQLSQSYVLAAVTNGNTDPEATDLAGMFEVCVFAEDCGFRKPDTRIFDLMAKRLGIKDNGSVLHVGDSLIDDIQGGNSFGIGTVWFNPTGKSNNTNIVPSYEVKSLAELPKIACLHSSG